MTTKKAITTTSTDLAGCKEMVLWARQNRIAIGEVQVGTVKLAMMDMTLSGQVVQPKATDEELRKNLYREFGGGLLDDATAEVEGEQEYDGSEEDADQE